MNLFKIDLYKLGKLHAAILTNSDSWESAAVDSGKKCGDLCFPIIFAPEIHFNEFKSEIADMRNSVAVNN